MCLAATATTLVLSGSDIGIVAAMREFDATPQIGLVLALWGLGSLVGGLSTGRCTGPISAFWLLAGLSLVTLPMALASTPWSLALLGFVAGLLCAPTITATIDQASRIVPGGGARRGDGVARVVPHRRRGPRRAPRRCSRSTAAAPAAGFVTVGLVGLAVALTGLLAARVRRRERHRHATEPGGCPPSPR